MSNHETEKETAILKAARELFFQYGYKKTSVDEIARKARVGKGTVYLYFKTKEDLFAALAFEETRHLLGIISRQVDKAPGPKEKLALLVRLYPLEIYGLLQAHPHGADLLSPELTSKIMLGNEECFTIEQEYLGLLSHVLAQGNNEGIFRAADPDRLANHINFMLQAFLPPYCAHTDESYLSDMLDQYLELLFKALTVNPA